MIYDFSDRKQKKDIVERQLDILKKEYQKQKMPSDEVDRLRNMMEEIKMKDMTPHNKHYGIKCAAVAAALMAGFVVLPNTSANMAHAMEKLPVIGKLVDVVTFRDYKYESERNNAEIQVQKLALDEQQKSNETLNKSVDEINEEIAAITNDIIKEFKTYLEDEQGYQDVMVKSELVNTTEDYFTLKLNCYQGTGSGYEWNYFYTIDLKTGERIKLKDVFVEGADYITIISENIKKQMQEQMDADENKHYWLHDEIDGLNFKNITDDTTFYINENDNVVIAFNEGDVAPMYMGTVEFEIPNDILSDIRK